MMFFQELADLYIPVAAHLISFLENAAALRTSAHDIPSIYLVYKIRGLLAYCMKIQCVMCVDIGSVLFCFSTGELSWCWKGWVDEPGIKLFIQIHEGTCDCSHCSHCFCFVFLRAHRVCFQIHSLKINSWKVWQCSSLCIMFIKLVVFLLPLA